VESPEEEQDEALPLVGVKRGRARRNDSLRKNELESLLTQSQDTPAKRQRRNIDYRKPTPIKAENVGLSSHEEKMIQ
jgi:hypothetical protein